MKLDKLQSPATLCIEDLIDKVSSLPQVKNKTLWVYSENHLMDKSKGVSFPAVGVVYEGIRSTEDFPGESRKVGFSAELIASVILLMRTDAIVGASSHEDAVNLLDDLRQAILGTKSPTGHFWKFIVEAAANETKGTIVWMQRWSVPCNVVPRINRKD